MKSIEKSGYLTNCRAKSTYPLSYRHWFQTTASNFLKDQGRMKTFSLLQPLLPCRLSVLSINYGQWHRYEMADVAVAVADVVVVVKVPANKSHPVVVDTGWFETFVEAKKDTHSHLAPSNAIVISSQLTLSVLGRACTASPFGGAFLLSFFPSLLGTFTALAPNGSIDDQTHFKCVCVQRLHCSLCPLAPIGTAHWKRSISSISSSANWCSHVQRPGWGNAMTALLLN